MPGVGQGMTHEQRRDSGTARVSKRGETVNGGR